MYWRGAEGSNFAKRILEIRPRTKRAPRVGSHCITSPFSRVSHNPFWWRWRGIEPLVRSTSHVGALSTVKPFHPHDYDDHSSGPDISGGSTTLRRELPSPDDWYTAGRGDVSTPRLQDSSRACHRPA